MNKNKRLLVIQIVIALAMLGVAFAFVPLYRLMCQVLNIPVPRIAVGEKGGMAPTNVQKTDRVIEVRFVGEAAKGVPVRFAPVNYKMKVHVGEPVLTAYIATNTSPAGMDGVAVHMLYGMGGNKDGDISKYVDLRQCFCFELQHYPGNEEKKLPLNFIITPDLPAGVHTITFAYTLFKALPNDARIRKK